MISPIFEIKYFKTEKEGKSYYFSLTEIKIENEYENVYEYSIKFNPLFISDKFQILKTFNGFSSNTNSLTLSNKTAKFNRFIEIHAKFQNLRIGTFVLSRLINWGQKKSRLNKVYYELEELELSEYSTNFDLRNHFYKKIGFVIKFDDRTQSKGSLNGSINSLKPEREIYDTFKIVEIGDECLSLNRKAIEETRQETLKNIDKESIVNIFFREKNISKILMKLLNKVGHDVLEFLKRNVLWIFCTIALLFCVFKWV